MQNVLQWLLWLENNWHDAKLREYFFEYTWVFLWTFISENADDYDAYCIIIKNNIDYVDFAKYFEKFFTIQSRNPKLLWKNYYWNILSDRDKSWLLVNSFDIAFRDAQKMFESFYGEWKK